MKKLVTSILTFIFLLSIALPVDMTKATTDGKKETEIQSLHVHKEGNNYLIEYVNENAKSKGKEKISKKGGKIVKEFKKTNIVQAILTEELHAELKSDLEVAAIEIDGNVKIQSDEVPWGIERIGADEAHNKGIDGEGINIAVFDTGISPHSDLNIAGGVSFVDGVSSYDDDNGHGEHIAGIISSLTNDSGIVGAAPSAKLYAVKVINSDGTGNYSSILEALEWAMDHNINIINMSFGGNQYSKILEKAINTAYKNNILIFASAGNTSNADSITYPAKYESVIAVGAVDKEDNHASFSNTGNEMELVAPGVEIKSTLSYKSYGLKSGTSMSSAHAAGAAAILWSKDTSVKNNVIRGLMNYSALELGDHAVYGSGLVDVSYALEIYDEYINTAKNNGKDKSKDKKLYTKQAKSGSAKQQETNNSETVTIAGTVEPNFLSSPSPCSDNYNNTWTVSKAGATSIRVHFTKIDTEANYDFVRTGVGDSWSGNYVDMWSSWASGSSITVSISTDGSVQSNGFSIDRIEYIAGGSGGLSGTVESYNLSSPSPYVNNYNNTWIVTKAGATNIRVHFAKIETEANYDFVTTGSGDNWSGNLYNVWSRWSFGPSMAVSLSTDGSITFNGFVIDKIEYVGSSPSAPNIIVQVLNLWVPQSNLAVSASRWSHASNACYDFNKDESGNYVRKTSYSGWTSIDYYNDSGKASTYDRVLRQAEVRVRALNASGSPISGKTVTLSSSLGSNCYVKNPDSTTDSNGYAIGYIEFYGKPSFNITATVDGTSKVLSYTVGEAKYRNVFYTTYYNTASYLRSKSQASSNGQGALEQFIADVNLQGSGFVDTSSPDSVLTGNQWYSYCSVGTAGSISRTVKMWNGKWELRAIKPSTGAYTGSGTVATEGRTIAVDSPYITRRNYTNRDSASWYSGTVYRGKVRIPFLTYMNYNSYSNTRAAEDSGSAINGYHIDIFIGSKDLDVFQNNYHSNVSDYLYYVDTITGNGGL